MVRHGSGPLVQPWGLIAAGVATIIEAKLGRWQDYLAAVSLLPDRHRGLPGHGDLRRRAARADPGLPRRRIWIDTHTDQVIIIVSFVLGFWLVGDSIYLIVT